MRKLIVLSVFGTRPEAIKMCPLVLEMEKSPQIRSIVCLTGQHRQMLDQVMTIFGIEADHDLSIMRPRQTLFTITRDILKGMESILQQTQPDLVLVHGDTTTSFVAALAAFYQQIPVGHVEAGLRTFDKYSPFPEEMNRSLTGRIANMHFAPTEINKQNLLNEGVSQNRIYVTGNTVIDAFRTTVKKQYAFKDETLRKLDIEGQRIVLLTAHRRENLGEPLENIGKAILQLVENNPDIKVIYPVHLNPAVREVVFSILADKRNIYLIDPLDVEDMHNLIARSELVLTDSGGLQEEAPACGIPVLVLRTETERPEAVAAGTVAVVGVIEKDIYEKANELLNNKTSYMKMANAINPYGDGYASARIVQAIISNWDQ